MRTTDLPATLQPVHDAPRAALGRGAPVEARGRGRGRGRSYTLATHPESLPLPGQVLQAFRRQQDGNDGLQMRRPGKSAQPSTMQNVTPEVHARPEPCSPLSQSSAPVVSLNPSPSTPRAQPLTRNPNQVFAKLKPTYGANDTYATRTSAGLIGLGARLGSPLTLTLLP